MLKKSDYGYPSFEQEEKSDIARRLRSQRSLGHAKYRFICGKIVNTSTQCIEVFIEGQKSKVNVRRAYCEGVKKGAFDGCSYTVSNRQRMNKCKDHGDSYPLVLSGNCPAQLIHAWQDEDDGRGWIGCLSGETHNHNKPAPHVISQSVKSEIQRAVRKRLHVDNEGNSKRPRTRFHSSPAEKSPVASNANRVRRERQLAVVSISKRHPEILEIEPIIQILEFENFRRTQENVEDPR